ncbi:flagellar motor stator protein MotA [Alkalilimnicola ehrlichii]|uniref:flagellar motor stator protein MotA n=1 Tax=Alkalilimnicola ehrlichii TaxID=351052 RepID=UPI000E2E8B7A|nr:flagellar motor stator protein MotA [Alkalilimnicola ehrlichii]RFA31075.1 flagellar motor stator protein MotA [Alkalilimnicola ehrlichii]
MMIIIGAVIVLASVLIGYAAHGGNLAILWQPYEVLIIFGAAGGGFLIANPWKVTKQVMAAVPQAMKGSQFDKELYMDLLSMLYELFQKAQREGLLAIEEDVDEPENSELFQKYPNVMKHEAAMEFLRDYLRLMVGGSMNPFELENLMDIEIETHHQEAELPAQAINRTADALPGFGIIAALLGIVIAMGAIDGPIEQIGKLVAAALIGTFTGILAGYSFVGPLSNAIEHQAREKTKFMETIKVVILAILNGYKPVLAVEFGRKVMYESERPTFQELEDRVKGRVNTE